MIVRSITVLGENLGISTTAEGVETIEQFVQLRQQGCSEVQGYFISRPQPAAKVEALRRQLDTSLPAIVGRHTTTGSAGNGPVLPVARGLHPWRTLHRADRAPSAEHSAS